MERVASEYTIQEASAKLGVPVQKLRRWDAQGVLVVDASPVEVAHLIEMFGECVAKIGGHGIATGERRIGHEA